jgi:hypothetical protein
MVKALRGKASDRKLRLFAVASCRWAWEWIDPPENRLIVEEVEQCMDQLFGEVGMGLAARKTIKKFVTVEDLLVRDLAHDDAWEAANSAAFRVPRVSAGREQHTWKRVPCSNGTSRNLRTADVTVQQRLHRRV